MAAPTGVAAAAKKSSAAKASSVRFMWVTAGWEPERFRGGIEYTSWAAAGRFRGAKCEPLTKIRAAAQEAAPLQVSSGC
jgi:hypothetical protein